MARTKTLSKKETATAIEEKRGMEASIYNATGEKTGTVMLPASVFDVQWNDALMHQVVTSMRDNARTPVAHVKERGDVRGGGRKPWQQKGTGRARHGSIRSPIWRGGGVTHGPRNEKSYARAIPRKMRSKALAMALSRKLRDGEVVFVDSFAFQAPKTALAKKTLQSLSDSLGLKNFIKKGKNAALVALFDPKEAATKSFRNIGNVEVKPVRDLNPVSVLQHSYLFIENPDAAVTFLQERMKGAGKGIPRKTSRETASEELRITQKGDQ